MALTVLSVAFPFAPVGPCGVGSAERILGELDAALVAEGQRSVVVACAGSLVAGELFSAPIPERALISESDRRWHRWRFQAAIDRALSKHRIDLIHMHGVDFDQHVLPPDIPILVTLHVPIDWYRPEAWVTFGDRAQFQCVSAAQRSTCSALADVPVIENGVPLPAIRLDREREDFALALGRICPEKNVHEALEAGTRAGTRVLVAIRADDILLAREPLAGLSARNQLAGEVDRLVRHKPEAEVIVRTGHLTWIVSVVENALEQLALFPGTSVHLIIKARSCHILGLDYGSEPDC